MMPQNNNHTNCSSVSDFDDACKQLYPTLAGASSEQVHEQQPTTPEAPMAAPAMTSPTAFMRVVRRSEALLNFSKAKRGTLTTQ